MRQQILRFLLEIRKILEEKFHQHNKKLPYIIGILIALLIVVTGINLFIDLTETLHSAALDNIDTKTIELVVAYRNPMLTNVLQFITHIGDLNGYLVVTAFCTALFYWKFKSWRFVVELIIVQAIAGLSNVALKRVINRARPDAEHLVSVETLSYPSGHAMSAIAFYGFLIYLVYIFKLNNWLKAGLIILFTFLILAIGFSRVYLGVHYPSDVVGGYIAGFIWVIFCIVLFNVIDLLRKRKARDRVDENLEI